MEKTVMLLWINCFLTLCVFLVCYNLWSGSPNGGSPYSGELDCGSSILKQPNSLLYKILSFSGFCIQKLLLQPPFWIGSEKSLHPLLCLQVDWFWPSCCSSPPSTLSCPAGEGWCMILCISCPITCKSCGKRNISLRWHWTEYLLGYSICCYIWENLALMSLKV